MLNFQAEHIHTLPDQDYLRIIIRLPQSDQMWEARMQMSGDEAKDSVALAALLRQLADKLDPSRYEDMMVKARAAVEQSQEAAGNE